MAIEAVGRTTLAIATSSGGRGERAERWGVGGDVVSCDRSLQALVQLIPDKKYLLAVFCALTLITALPASQSVRKALKIG